MTVWVKEMTFTKRKRAISLRVRPEFDCLKTKYLKEIKATINPNK
jgi:hypothetical protein